MNSYQGVCIQEKIFVRYAPINSELRWIRYIYFICDTDTYTTSKDVTSPSVEGMLPVSWLLSRSLHNKIPPIRESVHFLPKVILSSIRLCLEPETYYGKKIEGKKWQEREFGGK